MGEWNEAAHARDEHGKFAEVGSAAHTRRLERGIRPGGDAASSERAKDHQGAAAAYRRAAVATKDPSKRAKLERKATIHEAQTRRYAAQAVENPTPKDLANAHRLVAEAHRAIAEGTGSQVRRDKHLRKAAWHEARAARHENADEHGDAKPEGKGEHGKDRETKGLAAWAKEGKGGLSKALDKLREHVRAGGEKARELEVTALEENGVERAMAEAAKGAAGGIVGAPGKAAEALEAAREGHGKRHGGKGHAR